MSGFVCQEMNAVLARFGAPVDSEPLSLTSRGIVKTIPTDCEVLRISRTCSKPRRRPSGSRAFIKHFNKHQKSVHSLVPILSPALIINKKYVLERYSEIVFDSSSDVHRHMDLHSFCSTFEKEKQSCRYLYDIILTVADLHDQEWTHLDLSLENVALSQKKAYLIDFESCTKFDRDNGGFVRKDEVAGPLKLPFVPPEHFMSKGSEYIHLPSYDVWAFGVMLFGALFGSYLLGTVNPVTRDLEIDSAEVQYLCDHGLTGFVHRYHPEVWKKLTVKPQKTSKKLEDELSFNTKRLAFDLLSNIFTNPKRKRKMLGNVVFYSPQKRFTARQIIDHAFWQKICVN